MKIRITGRKKAYCYKLTIKSMKIECLLLIALGYLILPFSLFAQDNSTLEQRADSLYRNFEEKQALDIYRKIVDREPNNYRALWRTSFLYSRVGHRLEDKDQKKEYYNTAIDIAKRALQVDSTDTQSNFVMAVALGRKAMISGVRERVAAARDIKKYADRAIQYDSSNAGAWHVLGRWHFKLANLSWIERAAANTLFGGLPREASNEEAAESIEKAIELNQDYILYYYDLATVYDELGKDQQAISTCQAAIDKPTLMPGDDEIKQDCHELIADLQ
jgi:tetratricopeptide (TPR) repeat protein